MPVVPYTQHMHTQHHESLDTFFILCLPDYGHQSPSHVDGDCKRNKEEWDITAQQREELGGG